MGDLWKEAFLYALQDFKEKMASFVPSILAMILIIVLGLLLSWLAKWIFAYLLRKVGTDRWSERWGFSVILRNAGIRKPASQVLSLLLFWVLLISFLMIGINALQIQATSLLISKFFGYLPHGVIGILILLGGWILANFLGHSTLVWAVNAGIDFAPFIARVVRWSVFVLALSIALIQLGIAQQMVVAIFSILFGGFVLALALAFGLGGKDLAKQFLEKKVAKGGETKKEKGEEMLHL